MGKFQYRFLFTLLFALAIGFLPSAILRADDPPDATGAHDSSAATRPAWMQKDPSQWPQIMLRNKLTMPDGSTAESGSSGLMRLPNGVVVLGTAGHLLQAGEMANFKNAFRSWVAFSPAHPNAGAAMTQVGFDTANPPALDILVLCPKTQHENWPGLVLPIREEPLKPGDVIYLVAVPFDDKSAQKVFPGVVVSNRHNDDGIQYNVEGTFNTQGCSGAPVIDDQGRFAAINTGHLLEQTIPGKMQLVGYDVTDVFKAITLPKDVKPIPVVTAATRPATPAAATPAAATPAAATPAADAPAGQPAAPAPADTITPQDKELHLAKVYVDSKMYDAARPKLQHIVDTYPGTPAAEQAKAMLSQIEGQ